MRGSWHIVLSGAEESLSKCNQTAHWGTLSVCWWLGPKKSWVIRAKQTLWPSTWLAPLGITESISELMGDQNSAMETFGPAGLFSVPSKVIENLIWAHRPKSTRTPDALPSSAPFSGNESCNIKLLCFLHETTWGLDEDGQVKISYHNISNGFDEVNHRLLLIRL